MPEEPTKVRPAEHRDVEQMLDLLEVVAAEGRWIGTEAPIDRAAKREGFRQSIVRTKPRSSSRPSVVSSPASSVFGTVAA